MSQRIASSEGEPGARRFGIGRKARESLLAVALVLLWLLFWEFSIQSGLMDRRFFAPPTVFLLTFVNLLTSGELGQHVSATVERLSVGYLLGALPALLIGTAIGRRAWLNAGCGPLLVILGAFPATALLPLTFLIFNLDYGGRVAVAISVFFPVLYCTRTALASRGIVLSGADSLPARGAGPQSTRVVTTEKLRWVFVGLKLAGGVGLVTLIAAEILGTKVGLGYMIWTCWLTFSVETLYVALTVTAALGSLLWLALSGLEGLAVWILAQTSTSDGVRVGARDSESERS